MSIQSIETDVSNDCFSRLPNMAIAELDTTRERIVEAAGQIFAERGFDATTVRDICQQAEANVAAVNYYFGDKQKLYVEAVVRAHRWRMEQAALPDWNESTPPEKKLADFVATFIRRVRTGPENTWHTRLIMREMMNPHEACAELVQSSIRPQFEILQSLLRDLSPALSDEELHLTAFSIVGQCLFYHFADPVVRNLLATEEYGSLDVNKLADHIHRFSLAAVEGAASGATAKGGRP
jgi:TetR/AcrR family transcriptional regulator, regulator of cefoperazone and chloramphenicol sensitivity